MLSGSWFIILSLDYRQIISSTHRDPSGRCAKKALRAAQQRRFISVTGYISIRRRKKVGQRRKNGWRRSRGLKIGEEKDRWRPVQREGALHEPLFIRGGAEPLPGQPTWSSPALAKSVRRFWQSGQKGYPAPGLLSQDRLDLADLFLHLAGAVFSLALNFQCWIVADLPGNLLDLPFDLMERAFRLIPST